MPAAEPDDDGDFLGLVSDYAVLMDADTGAVLFEKDAYATAHPASTTKIMTAYLAIKYGNPSDIVTMNEEGVEYCYSDSANLGTRVGEQFTLEELLYGTLVYSANDMATQVASYIGDGVSNFVDMMNEEAAELGCVNTHFGNACGLPDEGHTTCAYDLALMTRAAMEQPLFVTISSTIEHMIPETDYYEARYVRNRVPLLVNESLLYEPVIGGKTGFTDLALSTLVTFAEKDGHRLIAVTMHANNIELCGSDQIDMYEYGFAHFDELFEEARDTIQSEEEEEPEPVEVYNTPVPPRTGESVTSDGETYVPYEKKDSASHKKAAIAVILVVLLLLTLLAIRIVIVRQRRKRKRRRRQNR